MNTNLEFGESQRLKEAMRGKGKRDFEDFIKFYESENSFSSMYPRFRGIFLVYKGKIYEDVMVITETVRLDTRCRIAREIKRDRNPLVFGTRTRNSCVSELERDL